MFSLFLGKIIKNSKYKHKHVRCVYSFFCEHVLGWESERMRTRSLGDPFTQHSQQIRRPEKNGKERVVLLVKYERLFRIMLTRFLFVVLNKHLFK